MSTPFAPTEVSFNTEATVAENAEAPGSNTFGSRIPCLSFSPTMTQDRMSDGGYQARMDSPALSGSVLGVREGGFEMEANMIGLLTDPGSSTIATVPWLATLLGGALGGLRTAGSGTTVTGSGSSTTSVNVTSSAGFLAGEVVFVGARGDGRAEGSAAVVTAVSVGNITVTPALAGAPANNDVVRKAATIYHDETAVADGELDTFRFRLGKREAGAQYQLLGCAFTGVSINYAPRVVPTVRLTAQAAYWTRHTATIPSGGTLLGHYSAPVAGGAAILWDWSGTTRTLCQARALSLEISTPTEPVEAVGPGTGTAAQYQTVFGWQRTGFSVRVSLTVPFDTAWETLWTNYDGSSTPGRSLLFYSNNTPARRSGFYIPKLIPVGPKPVVTEWNGQTAMVLNFEAAADSTLSTELEKSALRIFLG